MAAISETPSSIMYADLRQFGGISNTDAARILLTDRIMFGGTSPRDRVSSRTYLSREVVHVDPSRVNPSIFTDFSISTQTLYSRIISRVNSEALVSDHYTTETTEAMCATLTAHGLDAQMYHNEVARLRQVCLRTEHDRPLLLLMLFCVTGCLADAREATVIVEAFARNKLAQDLATVTVAQSARSVTVLNDQGVSLGLLREIGGTAVPPIIPLNPSGSTVGALATGPGAITNVEADVSRTHARIWREGDRWLCEGLGSTNGTTLIKKGVGTAISIEPPRSRRASWGTYPPVEIEEGDVLQFGLRTKYLVLNVHTR